MGTRVKAFAEDKHASTIAELVAEDHDDAIAMCLELGNLHDRSGDELPVAMALADAYAADGIRVRLQHLSETSANVVAVLPGHAGVSAPSLMLNSHLDTEGWVPENTHERQRLRGAWRDGDVLIGKGLVNAKVHLVAQRFAARALSRSGLELAGDLVLTGSAQETGVARPSFGPAAGEAPHEQEGVGARWLVDHGVLADFAIVGEPTGFAICRAQAGYVRVRVDVEGEVPYTPFVVRTPTSSRPATTNPFEAAASVLTAIADWATEYERAAVLNVGNGRVEPKAQVQAVRAGTAAFTETRDICQIFVDVRTAPGADALTVLRNLSRRLRAAGPVVAVECFDHRRGYVAKEADGLVGVVQAAHRTVFGEAPPSPAPAQMSMWQDSNAFNEVGMRAISYGIRPVPESHTRERIRGMRVEDLRSLTTVYALSALGLCGRPSASQP